MNMKRFLAAAAAAVMCMSAAAVPASAEWVTEGKSVMYADDEGALLTGWQKIDGKKYYFDSEGVLRTGWVKFANGKRYYITKDKGCLTGWQTIGKNRYYFNSDGSAKTGWMKTTSGKRYYFTSKGVMVTSENYPDGIKISGKVYKFNEKGVWDGEAVTASDLSSSDSGKSLTALRAEAMEKVQFYKGEYDRYCELKEEKFKVRDLYYEYAEFISGFMDWKLKALVSYSNLTYSEVNKINRIVADICAETGENDMVYWNNKDNIDFYAAIYKQCNKIAQSYNLQGTDYNDEIADALKKRQEYVDLYNKYDQQIKKAKK